MTNPAKLYSRLLANPNSIISFRDFEALLVSFGFTMRQGKGSHRHFTHPEVAAVLTVQPRGKDAVPYQVKRLLAVIAENDLHGRMSTPHYHINLFWSDEDDCWIANVPDLKYCSAHGDTPDEAIASVQDAIEGWLETAEANGMVIPEPTYRSPEAAAA